MPRLVTGSLILVKWATVRLSALDDLYVGVCRGRRCRLRGGGRVGGGCRVERRRRRIVVEDCVGCNQMSEGSLKSSRHVDGYISCSVSLYTLQSAWDLVTNLGREPDKLAWCRARMNLSYHITPPMTWDLSPSVNEGYGMASAMIRRITSWALIISQRLPT